MLPSFWIPAFVLPPPNGLFSEHVYRLWQCHHELFTSSPHFPLELEAPHSPQGHTEAPSLSPSAHDASFSVGGTTMSTINQGAHLSGILYFLSWGSTNCESPRLAVALLTEGPPSAHVC